MHLKLNTALTIAGSDSSGGAGIQADIKTMTANGVYAMSAVTALTAQNTMGVSGILEVTPEFLAQQIDAVFADIRPDAVKIGMTASASLVNVIADKLRMHRAECIVLDPVMIATSGAQLMDPSAVACLRTKLFPHASLVTPNLPEAEVLAGMAIHEKADMLRAAEMIAQAHGCAVLIKGGHSAGNADDLLYADGTAQWFGSPRIDNPNTHGTGCTLSSAIASNLAKGYDMVESVARAKEYVSGTLSAMLDLGHGSGPLHHGYDLKSTFIPSRRSL